jgi:hypothetical protein
MAGWSKTTHLMIARKRMREREREREREKKERERSSVKYTF